MAQSLRQSCYLSIPLAQYQLSLWLKCSCFGKLFRDPKQLCFFSDCILMGFFFFSSHVMLQRCWKRKKKTYIICICLQSRRNNFSLIRKCHLLKCFWKGRNLFWSTSEIDLIYYIVFHLILYYSLWSWKISYMVKWFI